MKIKHLNTILLLFSSFLFNVSIFAEDNGDMDAFAESESQSALPQESYIAEEGENTKEPLLSDNEGFVCDPVVFVSAQNEKRFDILKELAEEHGFEITILKSEDKPISLEKKQTLSKVIDSITRDMNVVLHFAKRGDCNVLSKIAVINNEEWSRLGSNEVASGNFQQYKPQRFRESRELNGYASAPDELSEKQKKRRAKSESRKGNRLQKGEIESEESLKGRHRGKGMWKKASKGSGIEIPDMNAYVEEVLSGERKPDMRKMSIKQRSEYMKVRRQLRGKQNE